MPRPRLNCAASRSRSGGRETGNPSRSGHAAPAPPTTRRCRRKSADERRDVTAEATAAYVIAIGALVSFFRNGQCLTGAISFNEGQFPIVIAVDLTNEWNCFVKLIHPTRDEREGNRMVTERVQLTCTVPTYGGRRWWFLCPRTARRTTKLFLPNGGWHFWSRHAYRLGYACQREDRFGRLQRRAAMLNLQVGGEGWDTWDTPPAKLKWMRWQTYDQKYERWELAVEKANEEFTIRAARLLKWI